MKILCKKALLPLLVAAAVINVGCTSDQVEAIQPLVDTFNESIQNPVNGEVDNSNDVLDDPVVGAPVDEPIIDVPAEDPVVEEPVVDVPSEDPVVEEPVVDVPVEDPVVEEPVVDVPVDDPVVDTPVGPEEIEPTGIITEVAIGETQGVFLAGLPPEPVGSLTLQQLTIDGEPVQFISGGSTQVPLQSDNPFVTVFVAVDSEGYFKLDLPEAVSVADLIVTFSTIQLNDEITDIGVQVGDVAGAVSGAQQLPVSSMVVGTGDLQVSVSWNTVADVDLYLQEPSGETIFFGNSDSDAGGVLDLDSNVGCPANDPQNENITYENAVPPFGEYTVLLDLFSTCSVVTTATDYVVTVRIGDDIQTFTGSLLPDAESVLITITTFEVR